MLRFDKVKLLYILEGNRKVQVYEINTSIGYADVNAKRGLFWTHDYAWIMGIPQIPHYYIKKGEDIYLMKEEPAYYV
jgi:hypothetical protein